MNAITRHWKVLVGAGMVLAFAVGFVAWQLFFRVDPAFAKKNAHNKARLEQLDRSLDTAPATTKRRGATQPDDDFATLAKQLGHTDGATTKAKP